MSWRDGEFDDLARELRHGAGSDLRAEAEDVEREVEQGRLRKRTMAEAAAELGRRGDRVAVSLEGMDLSGSVVTAGRDYLTLATGTLEIDLRARVPVRVLERSATGGTGGRPASLTFAARLAEYELSGERLEVVASDLRLPGRIRVAAVDHLVVEDLDGGEWLVPLETVTAVIRPVG